MQRPRSYLRQAGFALAAASAAMTAVLAASPGAWAAQTPTRILHPSHRGTLAAPRTVSVAALSGLPASGSHPARSDEPDRPPQRGHVPAAARTGLGMLTVTHVAAARTASPGATTAGAGSPAAATAAGMSIEALSVFSGTSRADDVSAFGSTNQDAEPPDTQVAAGPTYDAEALNSTLSVFSRAGSRVDFVDLNRLFAVPSGYSITDPRIAYDAASGRWFLSALDVDATGDSHVYLAVSASDDPTGTWKVYTVAASTADTMDQPKLGYDSDVVVLSWNNFAVSDGSYQGAQTAVLQKSSLLAGSAPATDTFPTDPARFDLVPAVSETATDTEYLAYNDSCGSTSTGSCTSSSSTSEIGVVALTGTPADQNVTSTEHDPTIPSTENPPSPSQPSKPNSITPNGDNDDRFLTSTYANGTLSVSGTDACVPSGGSTTHACGRIIELDDLSSPQVTVDADISLPGQDIYYPAVAPDANGNLFVAATQSSSSAYPETVAFARPAGASTVSEAILQTGTSDYTGTRWGDYSGVAIDPTDSSDIVVAAERAVTDSTGWNWGTTIGEVTLAATRAPAVVAVQSASGSMDVQAPQLPAGWQDLGGSILAAPAVAALPAPSGSDAQPLFVAVGTDHSLWERTLTAGWQRLASAYCLDNPAALISATTLYVACQGSDHALWYGTATVPSTGLPHVSGMSSLGGVLSAGPALAPVGGTPTFLVSGSNHMLYTRTRSAGYVARSLVCDGHPAAGAAPGSSSTTVACDSNGALDVATATASGLSGATAYGGSITDGPGVAASSQGLEFWAQSPSQNGLWQTSSPNGWSYAGLNGVQHGAGAAGIG